jgi:cysteine desulfurase
MRRLYLDYNATCPVAASVRDALLPFLGEHFGNPSSSHVLGRAVAEAIEDARGHVAILLGCDPEEVVFTSGGTESNNLALLGPLLRHGRSVGGHLVISAVEHPSVIAPARFLERLGYDVTVLPVSGQGIVQPHSLRQALRDDTLLVSIMHANNETGVIQPIRQLAEICHAANVLFHTDAAQTVGKLRTQVDELEVDLLTIAGTSSTLRLELVRCSCGKESIWSRWCMARGRKRACERARRTLRGSSAWEQPLRSLENR